MEHQSDADIVSTTTASTRKKSRSPRQNQKDSGVLSQKELEAWWPFTRLDPKRFPKQPSVYDTAEPAPF